MFVISTGALTRVEMSASGCSVRRSNATQAARTTAPAAISPRVFAEPQPQTCACEIPINGSTRPSAEHDGAPDVDAARAADRRLRHEHLGADSGRERP